MKLTTIQQWASHVKSDDVVFLTSVKNFGTMVNETKNRSNGYTSTTSLNILRNKTIRKGTIIIVIGEDKEADKLADQR